MQICAVFEVGIKQIAEPVSGEVISMPSKKLIGYAVFENGQMISPLFGSYKDAAEWMEQKLEDRNRPRQSGPGCGM